MKEISSSLYLPEGAKIINLSMEVIEEENTMVRGVQYQKINGMETIVDNVSRKPIFQLTDNPNVKNLSKYNPDFGNSFILFNKAPGVEMGTVYRIDEKNGNVYKVSHLFIQYIVPREKEFNGSDIVGAICILSASKDSYRKIIEWLLSKKSNSVDGLIVKIGNEWIPFTELTSQDILPNEA